MISSATDLKNRALMESNTLKSFILSSNEGFRAPVRDDILIHDYQMANSVTINTVLSNYIVNLKYAWKLYDNMNGSIGDSYFQIMEHLPEEKDIGLLDDQTRMMLVLNEGSGSFYSRHLTYDVTQMDNLDGTIGFLNLDTIWYALVRTSVPVPGETDEGSSEVTFDTLKLSMDMNNFVVNPNRFGSNINPFDVPLTFVDDHSMVNEFPDGFNGFMKVPTTEASPISVSMNCIAVNLFHKNPFYDELDENRPDGSSVWTLLPRCNYLVCLSHGFYGLELRWTKKNTLGSVVLHDLGATIPNMDKDDYHARKFGFVYCGFHNVDNMNTLFVAFKENLTGKYRYMYINEESYDKEYGFREIDTLVQDSLLLDVDDVFTKLTSVKTLDSVNIAMTNCGFWDLERNQTNKVTYIFNGSKDRVEKNGTFNGEIHKLLLPYDTSYGKYTDRVVEYDKIWKPDGSHYTYGDWSFLKRIQVKTGAEHDFVGATSSFAVYDSATDPIYILSQMGFEQFKRLLYATSDLVNPFIRWLYD